MMFSSLIVLVARDPGPVTFEEPQSDGNAEEVGLTEALMSPDFLAPGRFCRICWVRFLFTPSRSDALMTLHCPRLQNLTGPTIVLSVDDVF